MSHIDPDAELTPEQRARIEGLREDAVNRYAAGDEGALDHSVAWNPADPAYKLLLDGKTSTPKVHKRGCYICEDPEYGAMGRPPGRKLARCGGHIAADDEICDDCGWCINPFHQDGSCGLDPDGFEGLDPAAPDSPYGDFETAEPFLIVTGERWDGLPACYGDLSDDGEKFEDDYVVDRTAPCSWRGLVTEVKYREVHHLVAGELVPFPTAYECTVSVWDPGESGRQRGELVRTLPHWLSVIRKGARA